MNPRLRQPSAAGRFYPDNPAQLRRLIENLLASAPAPAGPAPKALIVPHAGYVFSGPIAASAYAQLAPDRGVIRRIILVGPSHFAAFPGLAASSAEAFATPLGLVPIDRDSTQALIDRGMAASLDLAHHDEHSLEVQLPFLQTVLETFSLVPLAVGEAGAGQVSQALDALWGGPETRIVISSDLSHYLDWHDARRLDQATAEAISTLQPDAVGEDQACGRIGICGLLEAARRHRLQPRLLDLRNSGDTSGPRHRVVGYGAFAFSETSD